MAKTDMSNGYFENGMFAVSEAYKAIRTNIILSVLKDGCKKIVVTSPVAGEGKSTTSVNVAVSLAQAFNKVLIIDCDLRKPRVHKALGSSRDPGLTNLLSGLADVDEAIKPTKYQNLFLLSAGLSAPNPAEMLAGSRMSDLVKELETSFDYIIFDTPPVNVVADALPVIRMSDGVALVVRSGVSVYAEIEKALSTLEFIDAHIIGMILNDDNTEKSRSHYGRYGDM